MVKKHTMQRPSWPTLLWEGDACRQPLERRPKKTIRMSSADQVLWDMVNDQDLFCIWALVTLTEPLQDVLIEKTLKYLLQAIPILNARPVTNWFSGKWQFLAQEKVSDLIERVRTNSVAETQEQLQKIYNTPIKATDGAMIRLHSIDGPESHHFVIQVHHLVMDGEGVKRLCAQFAEIYRGLFYDPSWEPDQEPYHYRSHAQLLAGISSLRLVTAVPAYLLNLLVKAGFRQGHKEKGNYQLLSKEERNQEIPSSPYFARIDLEEEVIQRAQDVSRRRKTTLHALLMASFSLAIMTWNQARGDKRNWLRFYHTANLRRWWAEPKGTYANFSSILEHEELFSNLQSPFHALAASKKQLKWVKQGIGIDVFLLSMLTHFVPYVFVQRYALHLKEKLLAFVPHNQAMTNIGIIPQEAGNFGKTKALAYSLLAPTVPGGCQLFTISTYDKVMTLYLGCSEEGLSKDEAQDFLRLWKEKILEVISAG
ncbi:MAG: condensation domain-containing protein [Candidatus Electrothrix scaldis]|nr:MAG: condensation domain-containing protein [Candidatus Electrothrix sp. GW3-3]